MPGQLFGGDAPSYSDSKQSPESTMTESQKAMQQYLTNLGKLGYEQGMQAFDPERIKKGNAFYNAAINAIQNGTSRGPQAINAQVNQTMGASQQPTSQTAPANQFNANAFMDEVLNAENAVRAGNERSVVPNAPRGNFNANTLQNAPTEALSRMLISQIARGKTTGASANDAQVEQQMKITPEMIEAYRRQKQAADDAALLAKGVR